MIRIRVDKYTIECDYPREAATLIRELRIRGWQSSPGSTGTRTAERRERIVEYLKENGPSVRSQVLKALDIPLGALTPLFDDERFVILADWRVWLSDEDVPEGYEIIGEDEDDDESDDGSSDDNREELIDDEPEPMPTDDEVEEFEPPKRKKRKSEPDSALHERVVSLLRKEQPMKSGEIADKLDANLKAVQTILEDDRFEFSVDGYWLADPNSL